MKQQSYVFLYVVYFMLIVVCIVVGYMWRGVVESNKPQILHGSMSYGFQEDKEVWNRIRVDEKGYVLCHKE